MNLRGLITLAALAVIGVALSGLLDSGATFTDQATNPQSASAVADFVPPVIGTSVIAKTAGGVSGSIRQGGTYYVYANVTDTGNPSSGVASVTANVSNVTTGQTAAALTAGTYTVDGVAYNYRSASLTASNPLSAGSKTYTLASADGAANSSSQTGLAVVVDNTVPTGFDVQTNNGGGTAGKPESGDSISLTYSKPMDPASIVSGWNGASPQTVVVRLNDSGKNDILAVYNAANSSAIPLGTVTLNGDYVGAGGATFGASGTASSLEWTSSSTFRVTLGTVSGTVKTDASNNNMSWAPSAGATDRAGNPASTSSATELGTSDKDF
jgi:hypothetical protein